MIRRENTQRRRQPVRRSRPLVLVVCGAKCTEPQYLRSLRERLRSRAVDIVLTEHAKAPFQVVEYASVYAARSSQDFDEVWCVVDVDEFDLESAVQLAHRSGIELAVSNPCFELWLLLHVEDSRARLSQCAAAHKRVLRYVPGYDKRRLDFGHFECGVADAIRRAKALDSSGRRFKLNPSTSVWRLVERMT